jgi:SAM-dependent methyltransferase
MSSASEAGGARTRVLSVLRCPRCAGVLTDDTDELRCDSGHRFPVHDGYIDLSVETDDDDVARTLQSFGYEWQTFDAIQPEDEGFWRWYVEDLDLPSLAGARTLDAGCGKGRYTFFTAAHVGDVVAFDGSEAAAAAARNLAPLDNVTVVRGDLRDPPLARASFDLVTCLGVLHHLPDPAAGFQVLADLLAPGGTMLIYVYSRPTTAGVRAAGLAGARALRRLTVRMPHRALRAASAPLAAAMYAAIVVPGAAGDKRGNARLSALPLQTYRGKPLRSLWLDTFDRLSAPLEARYTWADLAPWYERAGLVVDAVRDDAGLFVTAHRPA